MSAVLLQWGLDKIGGLILWNAFYYMRNVGRIGKHCVEGDLENNMKHQSFRSEQWLEYFPISAEDQWLRQFGTNVSLEIFFWYALFAERIWKDHNGRGSEELEHLDESEIHARRVNAKVVVLIPKIV